MFILGENKKIRDVKDLNEADKIRIKDFIQGAVYCWCKNKKDEWFSVRDLFGGDNFYWNGTPLYSLYDKQLQKKTKDPVDEAGKDIGWLLKKVLLEDKRVFNTKKENMIRKYLWISD
ncbi:MAG TPA: hypothetical protein DHW82_12730 [Spirochaetia bacterium]|nr:MAG: hypothetical protein A2Y41_03195 [Spirochaetes bacterium GWB1_36_13]HCL57855.1 hypothetical protein [Spirochaetia bacterium]